MKNQQEINNQLEILKSLDKELDKYDKKVSELIDTKDLEKSLLKCPPKKRAEVYWTAAFGIYTNKYLELILDEKDPELHPIKKEIFTDKNDKKIQKAVGKLVLSNNISLFDGIINSEREVKRSDAKKEKNKKKEKEKDKDKKKKSMNKIMKKINPLKIPNLNLSHKMMKTIHIINGKNIYKKSK